MSDEKDNKDKQKSHNGPSAFFDHIRSMAIPPIVIGSLIAAPFKRMLYPPKRDGWNPRFETAVHLLKRVIANAPYDLRIARSYTDLSIPGVLLPRNAHRLKEHIFASDGSYMKILNLSLIA